MRLSNIAIRRPVFAAMTSLALVLELAPGCDEGVTVEVAERRPRSGGEG